MKDSLSFGSLTNSGRESYSSYIESSPPSRSQSQSQNKTISEGATLEIEPDSEKFENGSSAVNKSVRFPIATERMDQ